MEGGFVEPEAREELGRRLEAMNAEPEAPASDPGGAEPQPEPAPEENTPEPAQEPPEPAPAAPPAPLAPPVDPVVESTRRENAQLRAQLDQLTPEVEEYRRLELERQALKIEMPSKEEFAEDPSKATERAIRNMTEATARRFASLDGSVQKIGQDVWGVAKSSAEAEVLRQFPSVDMEKYRPSFERAMALNPNLTPSQAIKSVANPADLIAKPEAAPMTPASKAAAAPRSGRAVRTGASTRKAKTPSSTDYLQQAELARQNGDERGRQEAMRASLAARLKETGKNIQ